MTDKAAGERTAGAELREFLDRWVDGGRLQTFEDRERFRDEANKFRAALRSQPEGKEPRDQGCRVPPEGWWCSREPGHDGPCAARPSTANDDADLLRMWRSVSGPNAGLTGPLIRFAALVRDAAINSSPEGKDQTDGE